MVKVNLMLLHTKICQCMCYSTKVMHQTHYRKYFNIKGVKGQIQGQCVIYKTPNPIMYQYTKLSQPIKVIWCKSCKQDTNQTRFNYHRDQRWVWPDMGIWHTITQWCNCILSSVIQVLQYKSYALDTNWTGFYFKVLKGQSNGQIDQTMVYDTFDFVIC